MAPHNHLPVMMLCSVVVTLQFNLVRNIVLWENSLLKISDSCANLINEVFPLTHSLT